MSSPNDEHYISTDEYDRLLQRVDGLQELLKASEIEKVKLARELRTLVKRNEINKLSNETQLGLNRIITFEKQRHELYVQMLLESCPVAIFVFDEELKFLLGSEAITKIIDIDDVSMLVGRSLDNIKEKYDPAVFTQEVTGQLNDMIASRGTVGANSYFEITTEIGTHGVNIMPFFINPDEFSGVLVIMNDITDLVEAKELAEQVSHAKSSFLSNMSHEIRTPLNAIIGMINIGMNTDEIDKKDYCLNRANSASKHLLGIINDILDMSKIEADKFELSYSEIDFEKMLINITNVANVLAEEKQQNFIVNLYRNVPAYIESDELRLSQIITNLLTNAIKFTPDKGTIILSIENLDETGDQITLRIAVTDTGIGISKEQQAQLFQSFNQADSSITRKFGGTGLGLAISKWIVELMGGEVWIESELGEGAKFIFTIKAKRLADKSRTKLLANIDPDGLRILAVDDTAETRDYFVHVMDTLNLACDVAASGAEALDLIKGSAGNPYNVFFVDWLMPGMDGIELTKRIRETTDGNSIVIMISVADWNAIEKEAVASGVKHFVSKPLFPSTLINAINDCIGVELKETAFTSQRGQARRRYDFSDHSLLIAEDVEINREIMSAVLEETGISIDYAENGKVAVSSFIENPDKYSLILMDINMPDMDGYEATRRIRALDTARAKSIPIIAMTADVFREDIEKCTESGMNDHTGKPIDADALMEKLGKYLKHSDIAPLC